VNGNTPLIKAVKSSNIELVKCLVAHATTDVNKQNMEKNTALHEAAFKGSKEIVDGLIAAGADVNKQNSSGTITLSPPLIELLFTLYIGKSPLHRAVSANHLTVVKSLLDNGANVNLQDSCT
jgi:uncharacterized protein